MERGYLVAALALIVTFTAMSHGARSVVRASRACMRHHVWIVQPDVDVPQAIRAGTMNAPIHVNVPDTSKLLAQLNLPVIEAQAQMARQMAEQQQEMAQRMTDQMTRNMTQQILRQHLAMARCARLHAMQEAERALKNSQMVLCTDCQ
jgi:hypothetical protein